MSPTGNAQPRAPEPGASKQRFWYDGPEGVTGIQLENWARGFAPTWRDKLGWSSGGDERFKALLLEWCAKAWRAEESGQHPRADFYFNRLEGLMSKGREPAVWGIEGTRAGDDPRAWRDGLLVGPIGGFLKWKLANGNEYSSRVEVLLIRLLGIAGRSSDQEDGWIVDLVEKHCGMAQGQGNEESAEKVARAALEVFPENIRIQRLVVDQTCGAVLVKTQDMEKPGHSKTLAEAIERMEALEARFPDLHSIYGATAVLQLRYSIALAKEKRLVDALGAIARAETYDPKLAGVYEIRAQLIEAMQNLQKAMEELLADIRSSYNKQLSAEGYTLKVEAEQGFEKMNGWYESEKARKVVESRTTSVARTIWREVGIRVPEQSWNQRCDDLLTILEVLLERPIADVAALPMHTHQVCAGAGGWSAGDEELIAAWVARRRFGVMRRWPEEPAATASARTQGRGEADLFDWLYSPGDWRIKLQAAGGGVLLAIAVSWGLLENRAAEGRETAWAQVQAAAEKQDVEATIQAAEEYLSRPSSRREPTTREAEVKELYRKALGDWIASGKLDEAVGKNRVDSYRRFLAGGRVSQGNLEIPITGVQSDEKAVH